MQDADDRDIMRQVVRTVAAAVFCLLCGGVSGIFVVRDDLRASGDQRVELPPSAPRPG